MRTFVGLAAVLALPLTSAFSFSPRPAVRAAALNMFSTGNTKTEQAEAPVAQIAEPKATFHSKSWATDTPSEEPNVVCFMSPSWMEGGASWVCVNRYELGEDDADDSY